MARQRRRPGIGAVLWIRAVVAVHRGRLAEAREWVAQAMAPDLDDRLYRARHEWVLGQAALAEGDT